MKQTPHTIASDNLATYIGDINLTYGGYFIHIDESRHYATILEYIDASNAGIDGETWIEESTVSLDADKRHIRSALDCVGIRLRSAEWLTLSRTQRAVNIAYALCVYGYRDINATDTLTDASDSDLLADAKDRLAAL